MLRLDKLFSIVVLYSLYTKQYIPARWQFLHLKIPLIYVVSPRTWDFSFSDGAEMYFKFISSLHIDSNNYSGLYFVIMVRIDIYEIIFMGRFAMETLILDPYHCGITSYLVKLKCYLILLCKWILSHVRLCLV